MRSRKLFVPILALILWAAAALPSMAQPGPEFRLGFATLAGLIPEVAGQPIENEWHNAENGDGLQRTTTGLMVWRKADNWTAFTDGAMTWINGPAGLQSRPNEESFDWEGESPAAGPVLPAQPRPIPTAVPLPPAPTATPVSVASPSPVPTPAAPTVVPSPTPAPRAVLSSSQPNVVQGLALEAGSVWMMGELRNDGAQPAYNVTVTARLLSDTGSLAGTASQTFAYLGAGDSVGCRVEVRGATAYSRAEITTDGSISGVAAFTKLPITWVKNEKIEVGESDFRYEFTGSLGNDGNQPAALSAVYVWFLDDQSRVVWMESSFIPASLVPGESSTFTVRTALTRENPRVSSISQVRYYAAGRLQ